MGFQIHETLLTVQVHKLCCVIVDFVTKHDFSILQQIICFCTTDAPDSAEREIKIFFKEFDAKKWYDNEEIFYNLNRTHFDPSTFLHTIDKSIKISGETANNPNMD